MANPLALVMGRGYSSPVLAKPRADLGRSSNLAHKRPPSESRRFFCACRFELWRLCVGHLRVCRVPSSRSANPRTAVTLNSLAAAGDGSQLGALPMHTTRKPSQRASAWRALAVAALHADSSLAVRLARYNAAMARARQLDTQEASA